MNFSLALPEIVLSTFACVFLLADSITKGRLLDHLHYIVVLFLLALGVVCLYHAPGVQTDVTFSKMYVNDAMGMALKGFASLAVGLTLILGADYARSCNMFKGELHALALFFLLGLFVTLSANSLLLVYLGLELFSLALYAAVAMRRESTQATEAAMKYFVLGALASGFLLYGMSMIYGATGSFELGEIARASVSTQANSLVFVFGVVFLVAGISFKLGVVPFHMWVPDVYQGSPSITALLISGASKLAAFGMLMRLLVDGLLALASDWQQMLMVASVLSLLIGNLAAIAQTNLKRMLGFSTIAQMGFMLLGMLSGVVGGDTSNAASAYSSAMFYTVVYVLTTLGSFGVILVLSTIKGFEVENISDLKGLNQRAPWLAFIMLLLMFSLAGIPPLLGFSAKLFVLKALLAANYIGLAVFAVIMSLIGAFYYIRVVKVMYFEKAQTDSGEVAPLPAIRGDASAVLGLNGLGVLLLGFAPAPLIALCVDVITRALIG